MEDYNQGLPEQLRQADIAAGTQARRASELGQSMGGIGGDWFAGQAQAGLAGQQMRIEATQQHQMRGLEMQMAWLNMMMQSEEAQKNRDLQRELENMRQELEMEMQRIGMGATVTPGGEAAPQGGDAWYQRAGSRLKSNLQQSVDPEYWKGLFS
jgi:hypothetical protein